MATSEQDNSIIGGVPYHASSRILVLTITVSTLLLVIGLGGGWYVHRVSNESSAVVERAIQEANHTTDVDIRIRDVRLNLSSLSETGEPKYLDSAEASLLVVETMLKESADQSTEDAPVENVDFDTLSSVATDFEEQLRNLRTLAAEEMRSRANELSKETTRLLVEPVGQLLEDQQDVALAASRRNSEVASGVGLGLLLLGVCGAVAGLLAGFGIARNVQRSMLQISLPVRDMAGRLNEVVGPINVTTDTNWSQLDDVLRTLADKTADVVRHLQESQQQSLRNEQLAAVGRLAAGLAHELRNPLMSMKLIVQTAAERCSGGGGPGGPGAREPWRNEEHGTAPDNLLPRDLTVLEEEIVRLEKMLQMFLDFARPPRPEKQQVDARLLIDCTLDFIRPRAEKQGVLLHGPSLPGPLWILADDAQMRQVLLNLVLNAMDALPGGGNIWLQVEQSVPPSPPGPSPAAAGDPAKREERRIAIRVSDDGPGLSAEDAERIFDPFVSSKPTGIGLGLSICRRIVESHDGEITVRNRGEGGAEFTIRLPLHTLDCETATNPAAHADAAGSSPPRD